MLTKTIASHSRKLSVLGIVLPLSVCFCKAAFAAPQEQIKLHRPGNIKGAVFVAEYHHIRAGKGDMFRTVDNFRKDLENYYEMGFRPVLASEYLSNRMHLPSGASPIVITFDDATPTQVQLDRNGAPTPTCAVGIWQDFARTHPDFPVHATFFVLPDVMWGPRRYDPRKVKLLLSLGCELGNHTITHPKLSHLTDDQVKYQFGRAEEKLEEFGQPGPHSMALPYGISPKNKSIAKGFDWKGKHYAFTGVFLVGANPAPAPTSPKFNRFRVPRIIAISGPYGIDFWLKRVKDGEVKLYVQPLTG